MNHILAKDPSGKGKAMLIRDCPWEQRHVVRDFESGMTGPSFSECAGCKYQRGINIEIRDPDNDWSCQPFPERLQCGFNEERPKLSLVKG